MSEAQHTPGPWKACDLNGNPYVHVDIQQLDPPLVCALYEDVTPVDSVTGYPWLENFPNAAANALVIAAAPTMLDAARDALITLEIIAVTSEESSSVTKSIAMLRAAIAQATGA